MKKGKKKKVTAPMVDSSHAIFTCGRIYNFIDKELAKLQRKIIREVKKQLKGAK